MERRLLSKLVALGLMACIFLPGMVLAQGRLRLGPVRLFPSLTLNQEYTSNFFLLRDEKNSNWIFTQSPQITALLPFSRHSLQFVYRPDFISFARFGRYNRVDHLWNGLLDLNFPGGLNFKVSETFQLSAVPPDFLGDRDLFYDYNVVSVEGSYKRADLWKARLGYSNLNLDFDDRRDRIGDYNINVVDAEFNYKLTAKTMGLAEFIWKGVDNRGTLTDNDRFEVLLGVIFDPTSKLTGTFKLGITVIDYDRDLPTRDDTFSTVGVSGSLLYRATRFDDIRLEVARNIVETSAISTLANFGPNFVSTGFTLSWDHRFRGVRGLMGTTFFRFANDDYKNGAGALRGRDDDHISGGLGLAYAFGRYYKLEWAYSWRQRDSNFDPNDFQEHRTYLKFTISL